MWSGTHPTHDGPAPRTQGQHPARKASTAYDKARTPGGILSVRALIVG